LGAIDLVGRVDLRRVVGFESLHPSAQRELRRPLRSGFPPHDRPARRVENGEAPGRTPDDAHGNRPPHGHRSNSLLRAGAVGAVKHSFLWILLVGSISALAAAGPAFGSCECNIASYCKWFALYWHDMCGPDGYSNDLERHLNEMAYHQAYERLAHGVA